MTSARAALQILLAILFLSILSAPAAGDSLFIRGDFNGDASLDLSDPLGLLNYLFLGDAEPGCLDAGDSNDDGSVDLSDAINMIFFIFLGGPDPKLPFPGCGSDPTADDLGCTEFPRCPEGSELNKVVGIRVVGEEVEVEVFSLREFPHRALFPILCIGDQAFERSRGPDDGSLNTLIFSILVEEFAQTRTGDPLTVQYGYCEPNFEERELYWNLWVFGILDKRMMENPGL